MSSLNAPEALFSESLLEKFLPKHSLCPVAILSLLADFLTVLCQPSFDLWSTHYRIPSVTVKYLTRLPPSQQKHISHRNYCRTRNASSPNILYRNYWWFAFFPDGNLNKLSSKQQNRLFKAQPLPHTLTWSPPWSPITSNELTRCLTIRKPYNEMFQYMEIHDWLARKKKKEIFKQVAGRSINSSLICLLLMDSDDKIFTSKVFSVETKQVYICPN